MWEHVFWRVWMSDSMCLAELPAGFALPEYPSVWMAVITKGELKISWQGPRNVQWQRPDHSLVLWLPLSPPTWLWNGLPRCWVASIQKCKVNVTFLFNAQEGDLSTAHHRLLRAKSAFIRLKTFIDQWSMTTTLFYVAIYDFKSNLRTTTLDKHHILSHKFTKNIPTCVIVLQYK